MKTIYTYISILFFLLLASCSDQEVISTPSVLKPGEFRFTVTIPELTTATRSMGDTPTDVTNMPMRVLVFDENGFFVAFQEATVNEFTPNDQGGGTGTYTVSLPVSNEKCILHFVLGLNDDDYGKIFTPTDSEVSIFSQLAVSDGKDAYWQRFVIEGGIHADTQLPTVALVRNFAKISVTSVANNFTLEGYTIVNETSDGTVAPYTGNNTEGERGGFADFDLTNATSGSTAYERFTSLNPEFGGNTASIPDDTAPVDADFTDIPKYVYERNQDNASNPAYVLVRGRFGDDGISYYYKLDIVTTNPDTWITSYLNLYRNFHYAITINNVTGAGHTTIEGAMDNPASNNIGASVDVSEVNTIQDGVNELYVSVLDTLLVTTNEVEIHYEYRTGINVGNGEGTLSNGDVVITPVNVNSSILSFDTSTLGVLKVTPTGLPALMEAQEFVIAARGSGLSRRVIVRVRQPFRFEVVDCEDFVPERIGEQLTLVVRLPDNMPTSAFPLTLDIEPERKTLYPDVSNNRIPVHSEGNYTFSYQATVTYDEYRQNRAGQYVFKTNMASSATSVKVTNPFFVNEASDPSIPDPYNVTSFRNNERYDFFDVTLSSEGNGSFNATPDATNKGTFTFTDYNPINKELTLSFYIHQDGDTYNEPHPEVEIYADYLDLANAQTTTGIFTVRDDGECILYIPNDPLAQQTITFTINTNYAAEVLQLSSYDHATATVDYTVPSHTVTFNYGNGQTIRRGTVSLYEDANYRNRIARYQTDNNGQYTFNSFVGYNPNDILYLEYTLRRTDYRLAITVADLLATSEVTLERSW